MIETELILSPTNSVNVNSIQLCILNIKSTFFDGTFQNCTTEPIATFDINNKKINVKIEISDGEFTNLEHDLELNNFPFENATWTVSIEYQNNTQGNTKKTKTIQMDINIEPRPANQFAIL